MNAWSTFSGVSFADRGGRPLPRIRRGHLLAVAVAIPAVVMTVSMTAGETSAAPPPAAPSMRGAPMTAGDVLAEIQENQGRKPQLPPQEQRESETVRISGTVGEDLSRSLQAAGVPERQGREYIAALSSATSIQTSLSVADKFDLVILRENGKLGQVAYAGLDRVGRGDLELMKWTDGRETRWVDANGLDGGQGMEMPVNGRLTSGFGERFHPVLGYRRMHDGVDLAAAYGTPIVAAADGRVVTAGWHGGYGNEVAIAHAGGVETIYGHMSRIAAGAGAYVRRGQVIGYVGSTGLSTGPHLHYEVHHDGKLVNPLSVKFIASPIRGEELHAFQSRLRGLLTGQGGA